KAPRSAPAPRRGQPLVSGAGSSQERSHTKEETAMAQITFRGSPIHTSGELPAKGEKAPAFELVAGDLSTATLERYAGKKKIVNIFPSIDTSVCASSVRKFHEKASDLPGVVVLDVSADLPFAAKRFCAAEGLENVVT